MRCPHCGHEHPVSTVFCPTTGGKIVAAQFCTNCGAELQESWRVCPKCGVLVGETLQSNLVSSAGDRKFIQSRRNILFLLAILALLTIAGAIYLIYTLQSGIPQTSDTATLSPPLENVEFPTQAVPYPSDWPAELRFPEQFIVVDLSSGSLPDSPSTGWAAKLRYVGDPKGAATILSSFLRDNNWQIAEDTSLDTGGVLMVIERDNNGSGIVVMDIDVTTPGNTIIVATIFP